MLKKSRNKFAAKITWQIAVSAAFLIIFIEAVLLITSYYSKEKELVELNKMVEAKTFEKTGKKVENLISKKYIDEKLRDFVVNIIGLVAIVVFFVVAGTVLSFHHIAGKHLVNMISFYRKSEKSKNHIFAGETPNNEIGELIETQEKIIQKYLTLSKNLKSSEDRVRSIVEQSNEPLLTLSLPQWKVTSANTAAVNLFKACSEEDFLGVGLWNLSPTFQYKDKYSIVNAKEKINLALKTGSADFNWKFLDFNGDELLCDVLFSRIEVGSEVFIQATVRDITGQRKRELIDAEISRIRGLYLEHSAEPEAFFHEIVETLKNLGECQAGFVGEIANNAQGEELSIYSLANDVWDEDEKEEFSQNKLGELTISSTEPMIERSFNHGKAYWVNDSERVESKIGLVVGIPEIQNIAIIPLYSSGNIMGLVGIANRKNGFSRQKLDYLRPFFNLIEDLMEHFRLEKKIKEEEKFNIEILNLNEEILNSTSEGILLVDKEKGEIEKVNNRFLEMWNIPEEVSGQNSEKVYFKYMSDLLENSVEIEEKSNQIYQNLAQNSFDTLYFNDGRIFERYSAPLVIENEEKGRIWFFKDISEKKEMERALFHNAKLASIGELAAGVGHEINNPLAIIKGFLNTLKKKDHEDQNEILKIYDKVEKAASRIENIVSGLRTFSREDNITEKEVFSISELVSETVEMLTDIYEKEGVSLQSNIQSISEINLQGDRGKLQQVLFNLLANGKDSSHGQKVRNLSIYATIVEDRLRLSVQDNGCGIPEENQNKIFDPFFTTKDVGKGTGIGLSLAHDVIHNIFSGELIIEKSDSNGTIFTIDIPYANNCYLVSKGMDISSDVVRENTGIYCSAIVAEDEEDIRDILTEILEDINVKVTACSNGKEALDTYRKSPESYDLIISDMKMPVMDGMSLLEELRGDEGIKQPRFIFVTGGVNVDFEDSNNSLYQLIDGYLYKPFEEEKVISQIRMIFEQVAKAA